MSQEVEKPVQNEASSYKGPFAPPTVVEAKEEKPSQRVRHQPPTVVKEEKEKPVVKSEVKKKTPVVKKAESKPVKQAVKKKKEVKPKKVVSSKPKAVKKKSTVQAKTVTKKVFTKKKPRRFNRTKTATYHYEKALTHLNNDEVGRATAELHFATVLNRRNDDAYLKLGTIYKNAGIFDRAEKYFDHPGLKKNKAVTEMKAEMVLVEEENKKKAYFLYGATGVGVFLMFPMAALARRMAKKKHRKISVESDKILEPQTDVAPTVKPEPVTSSPLAEAVSEVVATAEEEAQPKENPLTEIIKPEVESTEMESISEKDPVLPNVNIPPEFAGGFTNFQKDLPRIPDRDEVKEEEIPQDVVEETPLAPVEEAQTPVELPPVKQEEPPKQEIRSALVPLSAFDNELPPRPEPSPEEIRKVEMRFAKKVDEAIQKGNQFAAEEKYDESWRQYRTAMALNSRSVEAMLGLAFLCFMKNQWELSLEYYVKVLEIDPSSADAHYGIGRVMMETQQVDEAIPEFQKTLDLDPSFDDARETLSSLGEAA